MNNIKLIWEEFIKQPFPEEGHIDELDLEEFDFTIAGLISSFIDKNGKLEKGEVSILKSCIIDLKSNIDKIPLSAQNYFKKLIEIGELIGTTKSI